jgi:type 1 glutamine amidotransferase
MIANIDLRETISREPGTQEAIRLLLVTGGHPLELEAFMPAFVEDPGFKVTHVQHRSTATNGFFDAEADAWDTVDPTAFDAVVLYDLVAKISDTQKSSFLSMFDQGIGLLALHQSITSFPAWDDYEKIIGGRFVIGTTPSLDGVGLSENLYVPASRDGPTQWPYSDFREDVEIPIEFFDREHEILRGLNEFTVQDLVYNGLRLQADISPLIVSSQIHAGHPLGWTRVHEKSRIVYLQLCHGAECQRDEAYRSLIRRSARWVARKS